MTQALQELIARMDAAASDKATDDETSVAISRVIGRLHSAGSPFERPLTRDELKIVALFKEAA